MKNAAADGQAELESADAAAGSQAELKNAAADGQAELESTTAGGQAKLENAAADGQAELESAAAATRGSESEAADGQAELEEPAAADGQASQIEPPPAAASQNEPPPAAASAPAPAPEPVAANASSPAAPAAASQSPGSFFWPSLDSPPAPRGGPPRGWDHPTQGVGGLSLIETLVKHPPIIKAPPVQYAVDTTNAKTTNFADPWNLPSAPSDSAASQWIGHQSIGSQTVESPPPSPRLAPQLSPAGAYAAAGFRQVVSRGTQTVPPPPAGAPPSLSGSSWPERDWQAPRRGRSPWRAISAPTAAIRPPVAVQQPPPPLGNPPARPLAPPPPPPPAEEADPGSDPWHNGQDPWSRPN